MKRRLLGLAALAAVMALTTASASGFGGRRKADCGTSGGCGTGCGTPCNVTYVDQKVMVNEWVTVKEEHKYWVSEPVTKKEKVKVKEAAYKDEAFKYTVNELVTTKEKVKVAESKAVVKEMEFTSYTSVPVVTKQMRTVCEWVCVPVTVTCAAAPACDTAARGGLFSRLCGKKHNDCAPACEAPCPQVVTRTVMQRQMVTRQVAVDVTTYQRVEHKVKKPVTTYETVWVEKEVNVTKCVAVEKTGTRKVAHWVDVEKEVNVTKCVAVEKTGMKKVAHWVDVEKEVNVTTYNKVEKTGTHNVQKCVRVEKMVKVAVYTPAPAPVVVASPCATPCASVGTSGDCGSSGRGGLFKGRKGHCCK